MRAKRMRFGAPGYTRMTNNSNDARSLAFDMGKINRSSTAFTEKDEREAAGEVRQWNQVSYEYKGRNKTTEGIIKYRMVSGEGDWTFMDLLKRPKGTPPLCQVCCQEEDAVMRHTKHQCTVVETNKATGMDCNLMQPPADRDAGPKHRKKNENGKEKKIYRNNAEDALVLQCPGMQPQSKQTKI